MGRKRPNFALETGEHELVGFGQVRLRERQFGHLARIIVSPSRRNLGFGRSLCVTLMREALSLHPAIEAFSLYVHTDNAHALGLYQSLGFVVKEVHTPSSNFLMEAPLAAAPPPQ